MVGHQARLRVVDDVGRIATLEADVDLGLELVGALPDDLDAGALGQRVVAGHELGGRRRVALAVTDRREDGDLLAGVLLLTRDRPVENRRARRLVGWLVGWLVAGSSAGSSAGSAAGSSAGSVVSSSPPHAAATIDSATSATRGLLEIGFHDLVVLPLPRNGVRSVDRSGPIGGATAGRRTLFVTGSARFRLPVRYMLPDPPARRTACHRRVLIT